jgi:hypothetical protein
LQVHLRDAAGKKKIKGHGWTRIHADKKGLDKLKHVPQCAARKLSAVSFQHSAFERHEIVAACKEYEGIVIQCAARKLSAVSFQLSAFSF